MLVKPDAWFLPFAPEKPLLVLAVLFSSPFQRQGSYLFWKCFSARFSRNAPASSQSPLHSISAWRQKFRSLPCSSSPHKTRFAGLLRGPQLRGGRIRWCSVLHPAYKGGCPQLLVSLTLPCAVFSCGQFNTVRLMHTRCRAPAAHGTRLAHDRTEKGPPPGWWRSFLFGFLFYIETWLSALIFMLFQIFGHHFDDQIRDRALFFFCLYFDPPFQLF